jgi:hypothetical protein
MTQPKAAWKNVHCNDGTRPPGELDLETAMTRTFFATLASAALILALGLGPAFAKHDDDDHDNGRHLGWYKHQPRGPVYEYPAPVVVYPAPPVVVYPPPAPVYVAPPPVYAPPASLNFIFPLK